MDYIVKRLMELQDLKYRDFHSKLMPGIDKELVIGVRTPQLRKAAPGRRGRLFAPVDPAGGG